MVAGFALAAALIIAPLQIVVGDMVGLVIHDYQPLKTAAMEANWNTTAGAPLILFAIPDPQELDTIISIMVSEALKTSAIEGEYLSRLDVMSSIRNNLGISRKLEKVKDNKEFH